MEAYVESATQELHSNLFSAVPYLWFAFLALCMLLLISTVAVLPSAVLASGCDDVESAVYKVKTVKCVNL